MPTLEIPERTGNETINRKTKQYKPEFRFMANAWNRYIRSNRIIERNYDDSKNKRLRNKSLKILLEIQTLTEEHILNK